MGYQFHPDAFGHNITIEFSRSLIEGLNVAGIFFPKEELSSKATAFLGSQ